MAAYVANAVQRILDGQMHEAFRGEIDRRQVKLPLGIIRNRIQQQTTANEEVNKVTGIGTSWESSGCQRQLPSALAVPFLPVAEEANRLPGR